MLKPGFPEKVTVDASTSFRFPVGSEVLFNRLQPGGARARIFLKREGQAPEHLFDVDLPDLTLPGTGLAVRGEIPGENGNRLRLVITVCTGKEPELSPKYLVGQISDPNDIDTEGTGVWVAEERPPKPVE